VLRGQGNVGFGRACNAGAVASHGGVLFFVNPDVVVEPGAAQRMCETLAQLPAPAIVGGDLRGSDGRADRGSRRDRVTFWRALFTYSGLTRLCSALIPDLHRHNEPLPDGPTSVGAISGALFMMRRAEFDAIGGFDGDYFLHFEDVDLCRRVEEAGGYVVFRPGAVGRHKRSTSDVSGATVRAHKVRSLALYIGKYARTPFERLVARLLRSASNLFMTPIT